MVIIAWSGRPTDADESILTDSVALNIAGDVRNKCTVYGVLFVSKLSLLMGWFFSLKIDLVFVVCLLKSTRISKINLLAKLTWILYVAKINLVFITCIKTDLVFLRDRLGFCSTQYIDSQFYIYSIQFLMSTFLCLSVLQECDLSSSSYGSQWENWQVKKTDV